MKKQFLKRGLMMLIALTFGVQIVSANTVEFAHVFVPDKANGATYDRTRFEASSFYQGEFISNEVPGYSGEHKITNGRIVYNSNNFRMPFLNGYDHIVGIAGHLTDMLDRVEIVVDGNIVRTIRKSALIYSGATKRDHPDPTKNEQQRKGMVVFKVNRADLPGWNESFQIRIRFAVEVAGFDKLDCKVVHGSGQIKSMQWTTNNNAELPTIVMQSNGRRVFQTECSGQHIYNLRLITFKAPQSVQVSDGIRKNILDHEIIRIVKTEGRVMTDTIDISFNRINRITRFNGSDADFGREPEKYIRLCDSEVGNISGGWGAYIYMDIADNLPGFSETQPYQTNLKDLNFCRSGAAGGQVQQPGGPIVNPPPLLPPPPASVQCDISVVIENAFISGATFTAEEAARHNFCQNLPDQQQTRQTVILPLTLRIKNNGPDHIRTPFTVAITVGGNGNFMNGDYIETIPRLDFNETYILVVQRKQSVICAKRAATTGAGGTTTTSCVRCEDNFGGIRQWNDRGLRVTVDNGNVISETIETNNTANVP